jgi:hypothetical protein
MQLDVQPARNTSNAPNKKTSRGETIRKTMRSLEGLGKLAHVELKDRTLGGMAPTGNEWHRTTNGACRATMVHVRHWKVSQWVH